MTRRCPHGAASARLAQSETTGRAAPLPLVLVRVMVLVLVLVRAVRHEVAAEQRDPLQVRGGCAQRTREQSSANVRHLCLRMNRPFDGCSDRCKSTVTFKDSFESMKHKLAVLDTVGSSQRSVHRKCSSRERTGTARIRVSTTRVCVCSPAAAGYAAFVLRNGNAF